MPLAQTWMGHTTAHAKQTSLEMASSVKVSGKRSRDHRSSCDPVKS